MLKVGIFGVTMEVAPDRQNDKKLSEAVKNLERRSKEEFPDRVNQAAEDLVKIFSKRPDAYERFKALASLRLKIKSESKENQGMKVSDFLSGQERILKVELALNDYEANWKISSIEAEEILNQSLDATIGIYEENVFFYPKLERNLAGEKLSDGIYYEDEMYDLQKEKYDLFKNYPGNILTAAVNKIVDEIILANALLRHDEK